MKTITTGFIVLAFVAAATMTDVVCVGTINMPVSVPHITVPRITTPQAKTHVTTPQGNMEEKITGTNSAKTVGKAYSKTVGGTPGTGTVGGAKSETFGGTPGTGTSTIIRG